MDLYIRAARKCQGALNLVDCCEYKSASVPIVQGMYKQVVFAKTNFLLMQTKYINKNQNFSKNQKITYLGVLKQKTYYALYAYRTKLATMTEIPTFSRRRKNLYFHKLT